MPFYPPPPTLARPLEATDVYGQPHSLTAFKDRGGVVFFFCGCERCRECARLWTARQKSGALPQDALGKTLQTFVVFAGDKVSAQAFAANVRLNVPQTALLPDPALRLAAAYKAAECPRVFVVDAGLNVRYTNDHPDDAPPHAPALVIISNAVGALRAAAAIGPAPVPRSLPASDTLSVLLGNGAVSVTPDHARMDIGAVDILQVRRLERLFVVRNDNKTPVVLQRLGASCGCTTAFVEAPRDAKPAAARNTPEPRVLQPGEQATVRVVIDVSGLLSGPTRKMVWVFAQNRSQPVATLELTCNIQAPVTFSPPVLNFHSVKAGTAQTLTLSAAFDPRVAAPDKAPVLVSTNPYIKVVPVARVSGATQPNTAPPASSVLPIVHTYAVTLSPEAACGRVNGTINFVWVPNRVAQKVGGAQPVAQGMALLGAPVILIGDVAGSVTPSQESFEFGKIVAGQGAVQTLMLMGTPSSLRNCALQCGNASVQARVIAPPTIAQSAPGNSTGDSTPDEDTPRAWLLEATIDRQAKPGFLQANITLTLANGERVVVPLRAQVVSPSVPGPPAQKEGASVSKGGM